jgi:alpha-mannosidase
MHTNIIESDLYRLEIDAWSGAIRSLIHKPTMWDAVDPERPYAGTIAKERDFGNFWEYNGHCKGDAFLPMNRSHPLPTPGEERADFSHLYGGDGRVTKGQARVEYNVGFAFGTGYFATRVRLYPGIERVDIHTTLINGDKRVRYRAAFPTSLRQGAITHEIPFGAVERPEGEFPAQSWMDVSDGTRGLAILNRGLPGNNVEQGVAMLSLLKCTALDEGYGEVGGYTRDKKTSDGYELGVRHEFDYALVPHGGTWREADLVRRGQELNRPLIAVKTAPSAGRLPARHSFVQVAHPFVAASALRRDGERLVLRVYETQGREARGVTVTVTADLASAWLADLLGNTQDGLAVANDGRSLELNLQPFQIVTVVLECAPSP